MFMGFEYMITVTPLEMKVSLPLTTVTLRAFKYGRRPSTSIFKGMRTENKLLLLLFLTRGTYNLSGFKKISDNFFVLGWLVFDDVSAKSAMKGKCVETLDGNI